MLINEEKTKSIIGCFYKVYNILGYGFLEKVYENALMIELRKMGLSGAKQVPVEVFYDNNWHFFDPDMEPNASLLQQMGRPSVATLASLIKTDKNNLASIYPHAREDMMLELFQNIRIGEVNKLMPQRIYNFASFTKFISYISWLLSALIYFFFLHRFSYLFPGLRIKNYYRAKEQEPVPSI